MLHYTDEQLATLIAVPVISVALIWTVAIFHKNRKKWGAYDIPIVAILVLSVIRNVTALTYAALAAMNRGAIFDADQCSVVVWTLNSVHTFQASALTTLAVIGLFSAKLQRKRQHLRHFLTSTHVVYHMFCLTTLCACVGVAAILAQRGDGAATACAFMPYQLDVKFKVFIVALHSFLAFVSVASFAITCYHHCKSKRNGGFDYLKKSTSDLSDLSLGMSFDTMAAKSCYDTYTIHKSSQGHYDASGYYLRDPYNCAGADARAGAWNSDLSNVSATVSSTNSRRPCLTAKQLQEDDENRTGLETINPVLIVCYLFNHLPLIILCTFPRLISPWPVTGAALWLGLLQDVLVPVSLGLVDTRFCKWISNVYRCSEKRHDDKLPHVGLDGKFRHFGSQPQSLETNQVTPERNPRGYQHNEHKFPLTNGSLYTSIDGRLPVVHNYRRNHNKQEQRLKPVQDLGLHSDHIRRQETTAAFHACAACEADLTSSRSNLHHFKNAIKRPQALVTQKQLNLTGHAPRFNNNNEMARNPAKKVSRCRVLRSSKSEDSLGKSLNDSSDYNLDDFTASSDDDYSSGHLGDGADARRNFDTMSSRSCYSITTEANGDFEFFQSKPAGFSQSAKQNAPKTTSKPFRITRSNSKRSLENFQAYIDGGSRYATPVQRSNSYATAETRSTETLSDALACEREFSRSPGAENFTASVPDFKKIFISDYI